MRFINEALLRFVTWPYEEKAQTMAEYSLVLGLVSIAAVAVLLLLGPQIGGAFQDVIDIFVG